MAEQSPEQSAIQGFLDSLEKFLKDHERHYSVAEVKELMQSARDNIIQIIVAAGEQKRLSSDGLNQGMNDALREVGKNVAMEALAENLDMKINIKLMVEESLSRSFGKLEGQSE